MDTFANWKFEKQSAFLYRILAEKESAPERRHLFARLAEEAEKQAAIWESKFTPGLSPTHFSPSLRTRLVALGIRILGPRHMTGILSAIKVRGMSVYKVIPSHPMPHHISEVGNRHKNMDAGNWLRASVFGANDGLVSNASLILGVAGASLDSQTVLLSGTAGMLAGAFSMACGEYVSVKSQREFFEKQIAVEKEELDQYPEEEAAELALIFHARGMTMEEAQSSAKRLIADPEKALDTLAIEELGINPHHLGSAWVAAFSSFASFIVGAAIPLVPFLIPNIHSPVGYSVGLCSITLVIIGATISMFTGRSAIWSAARMVLLGAFAGACTFILGKLLGAGLGI